MAGYPGDFAGISRGRPKILRKEKFVFNVWPLALDVASRARSDEGMSSRCRLFDFPIHCSKIALKLHGFMKNLLHILVN